MARAGKGMGHRLNTGYPHVGTLDPRLPDETDLSQDLQGNNQLAGNDQPRVHNERHAVPDETKDTQGVVESFELMDPRKRAERMTRHRSAPGHQGAPSDGANTERPGDQAPAGTPGTGENTCPNCRGTGRIDGRACPECRGTGTIIEGIGGA